jgi:hypothetical protein
VSLFNIILRITKNLSVNKYYLSESDQGAC